MISLLSSCLFYSALGMCSTHRCGGAVKGKTQIIKKKTLTKESSLNAVLKQIFRLTSLCVHLHHIIISSRNRLNRLIPPRVYLPVLISPCCLLGNMCQSVLPLLTRPSPGRTQAFLDVPLLPFLADVSAVTLVVVTETVPEFGTWNRDVRQCTDA